MKHREHVKVPLGYGLELVQAGTAMGIYEDLNELELAKNAEAQPQSARSREELEELIWKNGMDPLR